MEMMVAGRVQIRNQGHGDPVIAVDLVVSADDGAILTRPAHAQLRGSIGTNVTEVDRRMAGWVYPAEPPIGLLQQQRHGCVRAHGETSCQGQNR